MLLGERRMWKGTGSKRRCKWIKDFIIYIPILDTLQLIFKNEVLLSEVFNYYTDITACGSFHTKSTSTLFDFNEICYIH